MLLFSVSPPSLAQSDRVLESIEYLSFAGHAVIRVNFDRLIGYRKHFPLKQGITIDVSLGLVDTTADAGEDEAVIATEVLLAPQVKGIPLVGVTYDETDPENPVLIVRFSEAVDYQIKVADNQRALLIELPRIQYQTPLTDSGTLRAPGQLLTLEDMTASNDEEAAALLEQGKAALAAERFNDALKSFGDVLDLPDHSLRDEAERLLIDTRKRARAIAEQAAPEEAAAPEPALVPLQDPEPELVAEPEAPPVVPVPTPEVAVPVEPPPPPAAEAPFQPRPRSEVASQYERQLDFGRMALSKGDFRAAMRIFSLVLAAPEDHPFKAEAQKLLVETEQKINEAALQPAAPPSPPPVPSEPEPAPDISAEEQATQWLDQAQAALTAGDAATAITLLEKVIETPGHALSFEAQRMLDQARIAAATMPGPSAAEPAVEEPAEESLTAAPPVAPSEPPEDPAALMAAGREAMKRNDMETAARIFSQVLNLPVHPFMPEAERLLRQATRQASERSTDLRAPVIGDPTTLDDVVRMVEQGRLAITEGDFNRAIVIFTKLTTIPEHPHSKESLEMLGVARQRNNQLAHAKAIYQQFIEKYPDGEDAVRVKQRLAELISSQMRPKTPLSQEGRKAPEQGAFRHDVFGSLSQYYYYGITSIETFQDDREDQSSLISYMTVNSRSRNERFDLRSFFYGTHTKDFLAEDEEDKEKANRIEISTAYFDGKDSRIGLSGRIGRQSSNTPGVLGRFDGMQLGLDIVPKVRVNMATGFPVDLNRKDSIATETSFLGFNVEFDDWIKNLDVIPFIMAQQSEGLLDRLAIGEEIRYFSPKGSFFNLLDYDASYGSLNIFLLHGQLNFGTNSSVHFNLDYRNSPVLTTRNALISNINPVTNQPYLDLESLQEDFTEDEIRAEAEERTGKSTIATFGVNYSFSEAIQLSNDFTWTNTAYSDAQIADMLANSPDALVSEDSIQWNGRLTTNGLLWPREISILSLGYTAAESYDNTSFSIQNRAPFGEGWSIDSRLRLDLRSQTSGEELTRIRPSAKLTYSWKRKLTFEIEAGIEFSRYGGTTNNQDTDRTFGSAGYRWMF